MDEELEREITSKIEGFIPDLMGDLYDRERSLTEEEETDLRASIYDFAADWMSDHYEKVPREQRLALARKLSKRWV